MKKLFISTLFLLLIGQGYGQKRISFGVRGGYGFSSISYFGHIPKGFSFKPSAQIGGYVEVKIIKPLFLQVELLYATPGQRLFKINSKGYKTGDSILAMNCIQLPIQAKIKFGGGKTKAYYMIGVAPSFLLGANIKYKIDTTSYNYNITYLENRFTTNMMNTFGVELDIDQPFTPFVDFRYTQGLTNTTRNFPGYPKDKNSLNLQLILSIGVKF
jgi:hypothetical protein